MEYVTSWEQRGIEIGIEKGRLESIAKAVEELKPVLREVLMSRYGRITAKQEKQIRNIDSIDEVRRMIHEALASSKS